MDLDARFARLMTESPEVYEAFERFAFEALRAGLSRFSADAIAHRIRWFTAVEMRGSFKINNNVVADLAREFQRRHPEHADLFLTRKRRAA